MQQRDVILDALKMSISFHFHPLHVLELSISYSLPPLGGRAAFESNDALGLLTLLLRSRFLGRVGALATGRGSSELGKTRLPIPLLDEFPQLRPTIPGSFQSRTTVSIVGFIESATTTRKQLGQLFYKRELGLSA